MSADGTLGEAVAVTDVESQPRGFCVCADGRLVVAGERSETVSLFDAEPSGALALAQQVETGRGANWVRCL